VSCMDDICGKHGEEKGKGGFRKDLSCILVDDAPFAKRDSDSSRCSERDDGSQARDGGGPARR